MVESLWVKITGQANKGNFFVGGYNRLPNQVECVDEVLLLQLQESYFMLAVSDLAQEFQ